MVTAESSAALNDLKEEIRDDIELRIRLGVKIDDIILPQDPLKIEVIGKSARDLKLHVIYRWEAPYYFDVVVYD